MPDISEDVIKTINTSIDKIYRFESFTPQKLAKFQRIENAIKQARAIAAPVVEDNPLVKKYFNICKLLLAPYFLAAAHDNPRTAAFSCRNMSFLYVIQVAECTRDLLTIFLQDDEETKARLVNNLKKLEEDDDRAHDIAMVDEDAYSIFELFSDVENLANHNSKFSP